MGITKYVSSDNREVTISVKGRFDIHVFEEFGNAYKSETPPGESYIVDLEENRTPGQLRSWHAVADARAP